MLICYFNDLNTIYFNFRLHPITLHVLILFALFVSLVQNLQVDFATVPLLDWDIVSVKFQRQYNATLRWWCWRWKVDNQMEFLHKESNCLDNILHTCQVLMTILWWESDDLMMDTEGVLCNSLMVHSRLTV